MEVYRGIITTNILYMALLFAYICMYGGPFIVAASYLIYLRAKKMPVSPSDKICPECGLDLVEVTDGYKAFCHSCSHKFKYIGEDNRYAKALLKRTIITVIVIVCVDLIYMILVLTA